MRTGILTALATLALATAAHAEGLTIETRCPTSDRCTTYVEPAGSGVTVVPPVPRDSILICAGIKCFTVPQPEHLPSERRR